MVDLLNRISSDLDNVFIICFMIMFFISIKKCFWKGDKSRIILFILLFLTSPMTMLAVLVVLYSISWDVVFGSDDYMNHLSFLLPQSVLVSIVYLLFMVLFSGKIARWLGVRNRSLVLFVYLMFGVLLQLENAAGDDVIIFDNPLIHPIMNICVNMIVIIGMVLLYFLVIKELSAVAESAYNKNRHIFIIPPMLFIVGFDAIIFSFFWTNYLDDQASVLLFSFSSIIAFMFIWAFCVIIKNITATAAALKAKDEVKNLSVEVMEALANTIDAKDKYTNGHSVRVAKYSRMIAEKMGLTEEACENIYYMGLLHDIGKIGVPNEIINKPSRLNDEEYDIIKTHPGIGYNILSKITSRPDLSIGARWHHERFDGKGYPDRLAGDHIPLESRIIAIADAYDAMTSNRSYRQYLPQDVVRAEIEKCAGSQFDPELARYMLMIMDEDREYILHE